jgi:parallel beta-helix repeat protein
MKHKIVSVFYIIVILSSLGYSLSRTPLCLSDPHLLGAIIYIEPNNIQISENTSGQQFAINVSISRATNIYAYDFRLYYNSTILNGTSAIEGPFLKSAGDTLFNIKEFNDEYNSTHGRLWLYCTLLGPKPGAKGTGTLVTITFQTKPFNGSSILDLTETMLSDSYANPIFPQVIDGTVCLGALPRIRVPTDYPTIQQAINAATTGSTILVANGTYFENLIIDKTISLIGESKYSTVIDANNSVTALQVNANSVSITGFTIKNAASYAMLFNNSSFAEIQDNTIENSGNGVCFNNSIQNNVTDNLIIGNTQDGIQLFGTATIANNTIKSNGEYGLNINFSFANIVGNTLESNKYGIGLSYSGGSILRNNRLLDNTRNFSIDGEELSDYLQDIDDSNTANEKTIQYLTNQRDTTINQDTYPNMSYVGIINCTNVHVANLSLADNGEGILVAFTQNSTIENVSFKNNFVGAKCVGCQNVNITKVTFDNNYRGIELLSHCSNVEISESYLVNNIANLGETSVRLINCSHVTIRGNTLIGYPNAFCLRQSSDNTLFHNNIINNSLPVSADDSPRNSWDNEGQGNYWSSYNGTDNNNDGLGDTPYSLDVNQTDRYPLIHPYIPDIAVTNVTANPRKTYIGQIVTITVLVMNRGYENETFNVSIYANSTLVQTLAVTDLPSYVISDLTFYWNTSHLTQASYVLQVKADILPGEIEINDNTNNDSKIEAIRFNVDFNNDGVVNVQDLRIAAIYFGYKGDCQYDLNFDNIVSYEDLQIIAENFTKAP